ncbi:hypothetical protein NKI80_07135 [Mesorhizobium sp. M0387]|uniref:hypothetical protein n=1 Tax=Mesorhizobium sp. M0387 TaxID=2956940 RepID=UPI00333B2482
MFGLLDWIKIGGGAAAGALVAGALMFTVGHWRGVNEGRSQIESESRARAMALIEQRSHDNAEITDLDAAHLCVELGGKWLPKDNRCD